MDIESKKRNLSEISIASSSSPVEQPKKSLKMSDRDTLTPDTLNTSLSDLNGIMEEGQEIINVPSLDEKVSSLDAKVNEILGILKVDAVETKLDINTLQRENLSLKLQVKECEGTIFRLNSKVQSLEGKMEALQTYSMKGNLVIHNLPEKENENCVSEVISFMKNHLKMPDNMLYSRLNPTGDIRIDIAHRTGQKQSRPRPLIVKFMSHNARNITLSYAKNLKQSPYAISEQFPPSVREKRLAQVPELIRMRNQAKAAKDNSRITLIGDKLTVNSEVNKDVLEKNPLDTIISVSEPIPFDNIHHSSQFRASGSVFQGHAYNIHTLGQAVQALKAMSQDEYCVKSDHIMYAYNVMDSDGQLKTGKCDDGEWKGSSILSDLLKEKKVSNVILIVTRKFGGKFLGRKRFDLIKQAATEALDLYAS